MPRRARDLPTYEAEKEAAGPIVCYTPDPDRFFTFSMPSRSMPSRPGRLEIVEVGRKRNSP